MRKSSIFSIFVTYQLWQCFVVRKNPCELEKRINKPNINDDYPYTKYIDNNQPLNQEGYWDWGLVTELRYLRGPSIQTEIEGNN